MTSEISDRQQEIINMSLELIAESGIQGLTIKNLSKKIGFTESAVYRHFENKIQILVAILDFFKEKTNSFFTSELNNADNTITKIDRLFLTHFRTFSKSPSLVAVIFSEEIFRNEAILSEKVTEIMNKNASSLMNIIKTGQEKGEIRKDIDPSDLSTIIMGSLRMFVKQWHMSNYSFDLTKKGSEFINSIKTLISN